MKYKNKHGRMLALLVTAVFLSVGSGAWACEFKSGSKRTALLELYTSEGCSSCPPADQWVSGLRQNPGLWKNLIPVAFHVDYWDYIGWKDRFASPVFNRRQYHYRRFRYTRSVYTPGFFINGREWRAWFLTRALSLPRPDKAGVLGVKIGNGSITVNYRGKEEAGLVANIAYLGFDISSRVSRGENAGRTLKHNFIVLGFQQLTSGSGNQWRSKLKAIAGMYKPKAVAVWITRGVDPTPIQATGGWCNLGVSQTTLGMK